MHRAWLAVLAALLLFSPTSASTQYWVTGVLAHVAVIAYAFGALFCLTRRGIVWDVPAGTALLWFSGRRRAAAIWGLMTLAFFATYFIGYEAPADRPPMLPLLQR